MGEAACDAIGGTAKQSFSAELEAQPFARNLWCVPHGACVGGGAPCCEGIWEIPRLAYALPLKVPVTLRNFSAKSKKSCYTSFSTSQCQKRNLSIHR